MPFADSRDEVQQLLVQVNGKVREVFRNLSFWKSHENY